VSPILVRPVREQLEHDRIIRLLPGRYKRRFEVGINPGAEQNAGVGAGPAAVFPDAVLYSTEKNRKVQGVVEVETVESINHLEAMSQWANYGRLKVPFHLYVPVSALDVARRLSSDHHVVVAEIWSYDNIGDQVRFTLVHKLPETTRSSNGASAAPKVASPKPAAAPRKDAAAKPPSAGKAAAAKPPAAAKPAAAAKAPAAKGPVKAPVKAKPAATKRPAPVAAPRPARSTPAVSKKPARPAKAAAKRAPAAARGRAPLGRKGASAAKRK